MGSVFVFSLATNLLLLVSSIYMMQVFDRVLSSGSLDTLLWLTVMALVGVAAYGLLEHTRRRVLVRAGSWLEGELSAPVVRAAVSARLIGSRSEATLADVGDLKTFLSGEAVLAFLDAPWMPLFIALIWIMHPVLGLLALGGAVVLFTLAVLNDRLTRGPGMRVAGEARALQTLAQQTIDQAETAGPLGMVGAMMARWRVRQHQSQALSGRVHGMTEALASITKAIRLALQILVLGLGAWLVLRGELTSGGMIAASIILSRALSPVERALGAWRSWMAARRAWGNLSALFDGAPDAPAPLALPAPKGRVTLEGVRFTPPGRRDPVLKRIDLDLPAGSTCGLIGPSGAGKSTLCRLVVGAARPTDGHVRLDGADLVGFDADTLGRWVGYLPQQVELFPGTVADNIARMGEVDPDAVLRAAALADVHDLILRLPDGYQTDVGRYGHCISGGQRQRIGLARALYGDPPLIVLDEPNSNLDSAGEQALLQALAGLKASGRTVLIVAHQPSALRTADTVLVLKDGLVAAHGPRDEVLRGLVAQAPAPAAAGPAAAPPLPTGPAMPAMSAAVSGGRE